jgi:hypothetical protein
MFNKVFIHLKFLINFKILIYLNTKSDALQRHNRVKKWTKNIDLFEKDFIVMPIHQEELKHWFLAIVCYPKLKEPILSGENSDQNEKESRLEIHKNLKVNKIHSLEGKSYDKMYFKISFNFY